ncbi:Hcp family type VI secretion system effector [Xenorhabdus bovienii]|uniref:Hcp family type VI secretion system effector n=1 Tax=Xenorhabdus bovienii TaxID=40576 RepID=UPI00237C6989|nr:Hcp family type VI secretion system effector [Xenorhabdus bovienii]
MSYIIYLSLKGKKQGLISAGCSTLESIGNRYQAGREDEIQVLNLSHMMSRDQNVNHRPVSFTKPIDKSSPLLAMAIDGNELLDAVFKCYRTSQAGQLEFFYEIKLTGATIVDFSCHYPHSINDNGQIPNETVMLDYKSISCTHRAAGTTGYAISQLQGREEEKPLLSGFSNFPLGDLSKHLSEPPVETEKWIGFSISDDIDYCGIKCLVTLDDGSVLNGEFNKQNKVKFSSITGNKCVKLEIENFEKESSSQSLTEILLSKIMG